MWLATGGKDQVGRLWDIAPARASGGKSLVRAFPAQDEAISRLALSPERRHLPAADFSFVIRLGDVTTGRQTRLVRGFQCVINEPGLQPRRPVPGLGQSERDRKDLAGAVGAVSRRARLRAPRPAPALRAGTVADVLGEP